MKGLPKDYVDIDALLKKVILLKSLMTTTDYFKALLACSKSLTIN